MSACSQTNTPSLNLSTDECGGVKKSTKCVVNTDPILDLGIVAGATQEEINLALLRTIKSLEARIVVLENK